MAEVLEMMGTTELDEPAILDPRIAFANAVLNMNDGETVQDVLTVVDPAAAAERLAELRSRVQRTATTAVVGYTDNLVAGLIREHL